MVLLPVNCRRAGAAFACLALVLMWISGANAAGFGADDRVDRHRVKGSVYGAIGLVVHQDGLSTEAGTGFLVSPCHVMTAYHVVAGKEKLKPTDTATFYVGEGHQGPDYPGGRAYEVGTKAHPVAWGNFLDGESDNITIRVKAVQSNGWQDWVLLKLDDCLGDPAKGWGYLHLKPIATRDLTRSGATLQAVAVGLPKDKNERTLTEDPNCRIVGQMSESGWQHDCITLPGNSGGPILERQPSDGQWPEVLGITVSLILLDGMDQTKPRPRCSRRTIPATSRCSPPRPGFRLHQQGRAVSAARSHRDHLPSPIIASTPATAPATTSTMTVRSRTTTRR